jgi:membrane-bound serine protease (ClpP class)
MKATARIACLVLGLASLAAPAARASTQETVAAPPNGKSGTVYVIPIKGMIEPALLYVIRRGVTEATAEGAQAVVFAMDTPGGRLDTTEEIVAAIRELKVPSYTLVEKWALSAGALIALGTKHIYMAPDSIIGGATPILASPQGEMQGLSDAVQEKYDSSVAAMARSTAERNGHDPRLAEKMVSRKGEYKVEDFVVSPDDKLVVLTNTEAERMVGPTNAQRRLLSEGTVASVEELLETIGLADARIKRLEVTGVEELARFIAKFASLFLMAGILGIYIEFKTPGFGLPGILGILSLAIFFWGHHIAGLAGMEEIMVFVVGLILVGVEIFLFPGLGFIGITGACMMLWALLSAMVHRMPDGPWYPTLPQLQIPLLKLSGGVVLAAIMAAIFGRFLPKTSFLGHLVLSQSTSRAAGYTSSPLGADLVGREGTTLSALRPSGRAMFGDQPLDVMTRGDFVGAGTRVRIVESSSNRIIVEKAESASTA